MSVGYADHPTPSLRADDYYALLGVPEDADDEALRRAWRQLALQWHPDRAGEGATATFQKLSVAYEVLANPIARAAYDRRRRAARTAVARAPRPAPATSPLRSSAATSPPRPGARRQAPAIVLLRLSGTLDSLLASGVARRDESGFITLILREAEAAQGGMATVSLRLDLRCPDCEAPRRSAECARCGGTGTVEELFSAWLAVPPGVSEGAVLTPSIDLPGMVSPLRFRVRLYGRK